MKDFRRCPFCASKAREIDKVIHCVNCGGCAPINVWDIRRGDKVALEIFDEYRSLLTAHVQLDQGDAPAFMSAINRLDRARNEIKTGDG